MTYEQFVEELKQLITAGEALRGAASAGTRDFRDWRHRAESVVIGVQTEGYIVPGGFNSPRRHYRPTWASAKPETIRATFETDLGDSLTELQFIVEHFEKYGPPRSPSSQQPTLATTPAPAVTFPEPLPPPEHVTVRWIIDHVPVKLWWSAFGIVVFIFCTGFVVGQIPAARVAICWVKPDACSAPKGATDAASTASPGATKNPSP
jgi:hypothetical protein